MNINVDQITQYHVGESTRTSRLKCATSPGPDGLHFIILNRCADTLADPVSRIFQEPFETGRVPVAWRTAVCKYKYISDI